MFALRDPSELAAPLACMTHISVSDFESHHDLRRSLLSGGARPRAASRALAQANPTDAKGWRGRPRSVTWT